MLKRKDIMWTDNINTKEEQNTNSICIKISTVSVVL